MFDFNDIPVNRNDSLESRRYGRIFYSNDFLKTSSEALQKIFSKITPVSVTYDYARDVFDVVALCNDFDPVELGYSIPYYQATIRVQKRAKGTGRAYYIEFTKIEID